MTGRLLTADQLAIRWQVPKSHVYRLASGGARSRSSGWGATAASPDAKDEFEKSLSRSQPTQGACRK